MHHPVPLSTKDRDHIIKELQEMDFFEINTGREHAHFKRFTCNAMKNVDKQEIRLW